MPGSDAGSIRIRVAFALFAVAAGVVLSVSAATAERFTTVFVAVSVLLAAGASAALFTVVHRLRDGEAPED